MKKRIWLTLLVLGLIGLPLSGAFAKVYKIGVTQIITHPAADACSKGIVDQLVKEGFIEGKNAA